MQPQPDLRATHSWVLRPSPHLPQRRLYSPFMFVGSFPHSHLLPSIRGTFSVPPRSPSACCPTKMGVLFETIPHRTRKASQKAKKLGK